MLRWWILYWIECRESLEGRDGICWWVEWWYSRCSKKGRYDGLMVVLVAYGGGVM